MLFHTGCETEIAESAERKLVRERVDDPGDADADAQEHQKCPGGGANAFFGVAAMKSAEGQRRHQREERHQLEVGELHLAIAIFGGR
jgi:hypothetical protein